MNYHSFYTQSTDIEDQNKLHLGGHCASWRMQEKTAARGNLRDVNRIIASWNFIHIGRGARNESGLSQHSVN